MDICGALAQAGLVSIEVAEQTRRQRLTAGRSEIIPGVTFESSFDLMSLLDGIAGPADCRVYLEESSSSAELNTAEKKVRDFLSKNPKLGSMVASVPDILLVDATINQGRMWVGIQCRNAHVAWDVTGALRAISGWAPIKVGKITCPKVEQLLHEKGISM